MNQNSVSAKRPIAVSCGDPNGIGPDVILTAWTKRKAMNLPNFYVLGDTNQLSTRARKLGLEVSFTSFSQSADHVNFADNLHVSALDNKFVDDAGKPNAQNANGVIEAIERAVSDTVNGIASSIVTAPISKKPLYDAGFRHPGHTEFLAELAQKHFGTTVTPVMLLAGPELRTIPVTIHIPIADVPKTLTKQAIIETATIAHNDLKTRFGISAPRLAISGLNPHAGEDGAMGSEDASIIYPAIEVLKNSGIDAVGPLPADTMFHAAARARYDVAICMYHDQALIPAKALGFDDAVNVTLGLPFIRTSPDHGTAFDIAGTGQAKPDSFIAALKLAHDMAQNG